MAWFMAWFMVWLMVSLRKGASLKEHSAAPAVLSASGGRGVAATSVFHEMVASDGVGCCCRCGQ